MRRHFQLRGRRQLSKELMGNTEIFFAFFNSTETRHDVGDIDEFVIL